MADMPEKAKQAYDDYKNGLKYKEIADKYEVSISTVKSWAARHWKPLETASKKGGKGCNQKKGKVATSTDKKSQPKTGKRGAPYGNKNAVGHTPSKPFPAGHQLARRHGFYAKYTAELLKEHEREIFEDTGEISPYDELKQNYAALELQEYRMMVYIQKLELAKESTRTGMITVEAQSHQEIVAYGQLEDKNILSTKGPFLMEQRDPNEIVPEQADGYDDEGNPVWTWRSKYGMLSFSDDDMLRKLSSAKQVNIDDRILAAENILSRIRSQKVTVLRGMMRMNYDVTKMEFDREKYAFDREKYQHQLELEQGNGKNDVAADWVDAVLEADELEDADNG